MNQLRSEQELTLLPGGSPGEEAKTHPKITIGPNIPLIEWLARQISSPVLRLRFLRAVMFQEPASNAFGAAMMNPKHEEIGARPLVEWFAGKIPSHAACVCFLRAIMDQDPSRKSRKSWLLVSFPALLLLFTAPGAPPPVRSANRVPIMSVAASPEPTTAWVEQTQEIWQVEKTDAFETYSNGLRIDNRFSIASRPRSYSVFSTSEPEEMRSERRSVPSGIVFHTTESPQVPFEANQNSTLQHVGESLLEYVKRKRAYNFLIDRFGRVYRVVQESDAANHAGNSVWSVAEWVYLNLNESFLGVSFETRTLPGQEETAVNPAQLRSAAMLTEMLRRRYGIPAGNCVTHAQVSVNPSNLLIGYHNDWASSFPFGQLGLPDNYALPLPAVFLFGFEYDSNFARRAGTRLYQEAQLAEQILRNRASGAQLQFPAYKRALQERYKRQLAAVRDDDAGRTAQEAE
jgi:hypothetical protein